jgi:hypothetical protein
LASIAVAAFHTGAQLDALARSLTQLLERWSRRVVVVPVTEKISIPSSQWL